MPTTVNDRELRAADMRVGISAQTTKGAIQSNPVFDLFRRNEGKPWKTLSYTEDPSVNNFYQSKIQIKESESLVAELQTVTTKQTVNLLAQAIHSSEVNLGFGPVTDFAFTATGMTSEGDDFANFFIGQAFWITGSTSNLNNGMYIVADIIDDGEITTTPPPPVVQAAGANVVVTSYVYRNRDTPTYNIMQLRTTDLSAGDDLDYYTVYDGVVNEFNMEIPESGVWNASANFVFENEYQDQYGETDRTAIPGQTYNTAELDYAITSAIGVNNKATGFFVNNTLQKCKIKSLSLAIANNYEEDPTAACRSSYFRGDFSVSGSFVGRSLISNPWIWRTRSWDGERFSLAWSFSHHDGSTGAESYILLHQNIITEPTVPDGSGVVSHTECTFVSEQGLYTDNPDETITLCTNWSIFNSII